MAEALAAVFGLAFEHFHIHRLLARCDGRNHHSIKLMQTLGMRLGRTIASMRCSRASGTKNCTSLFWIGNGSI
ncbi:MAG: GNAT family N-acetyltransferase [Candidatus Devosia euplotis]|nr:GNAT family N-acetyltransferase [Candidatus Devosia euplotis]